MKKAKGKTTKNNPAPEKEKAGESVGAIAPVVDTGKLSTVYNPHTNETEEMKIWECGFDLEKRQVAQGFFPLSGGHFSILLEMNKLPHEPRWTVTSAPTNPIR